MTEVTVTASQNGLAFTFLFIIFLVIGGVTIDVNLTVTL